MTYPESSKMVSTRSRPKAAASISELTTSVRGFNTQPPEGGCYDKTGFFVSVDVSTRSRPKAAVGRRKLQFSACRFQHAAARRRLQQLRRRLPCCLCFNTQPPEGG